MVQEVQHFQHHSFQVENTIDEQGNNEIEVSQIEPIIICPKCNQKDRLEKVLTSQSNQNVIYECPQCRFMKRNIETSKG